MTAFAVCCANPFKTLTRAAAKAAAAQFRRAGVGRVELNWAARATLCERCPMRVIRRGVSYCGRPLLEQIERDDAFDGCGCPTLAKAKSPAEHCPLNHANRPAVSTDGRCSCKWCNLERE